MHTLLPVFKHTIYFWISIHIWPQRKRKKKEESKKERERWIHWVFWKSEYAEGLILQWEMLLVVILMLSSPWAARHVLSLSKYYSFFFLFIFVSINAFAWFSWICYWNYICYLWNYGGYFLNYFSFVSYPQTKTESSLDLLHTYPKLRGVKICF